MAIILAAVRSRVARIERRHGIAGSALPHATCTGPPKISVSSMRDFRETSLDRRR